MIIWDVFINFDTFKEFLGLVSMNSTTTGKDILNAMLECTNDMDIDLKKTVSITTDGAPTMIVKNSHFASKPPFKSWAFW